MIIEIESTKASLKEVCLDFIWRCLVVPKMMISSQRGMCIKVICARIMYDSMRYLQLPISFIQWM